jgi:hypothetical protein
MPVTPAELYALDGAAWLAAPVGEDAQPSEPGVRYRLGALMATAAWEGRDGLSPAEILDALCR